MHWWGRPISRDIYHRRSRAALLDMQGATSQSIWSILARGATQRPTAHSAASPARPVRMGDLLKPLHLLRRRFAGGRPRRTKWLGDGVPSHGCRSGKVKSASSALSRQLIVAPPGRADAGVPQTGRPRERRPGRRHEPRQRTGADQAYNSRRYAPELPALQVGEIGRWRSADGIHGFAPA